MRALIVEDDARLGALLQRVLREEGYDATWCTKYVEGLRAACDHAVTPRFDVVILDWMLPDGDGPAFCAEARRLNVLTPILMLTARGEVSEKVQGLRAGADDYLVKPFEVDELVARVDALVRRGAQLGRLVVGELVIDRLERSCTVGGALLDLTVREYELLVRLAAAGGNAVSRAALLRDVWRMSFDPGSGVLDVQVSRLRDKLGKSAARLETVRGVGYRLRQEP